jgi:hypothetical protein
VKRLRRITFNALNMVSLVLCMGAVALWVRSYYRSDFIWCGYSGQPSYYSLQAARGQTRLGMAQFKIETYWGVVGSSSGHVSIVAGEMLPLPHSFIGLGFGRAPELPWYPIAPAADVPLWIIAAVFAVLPTIRLYRRLQTRRGVICGRCPSCGYDLRASPSQCPECGAVSKGIST